MGGGSSQTPVGALLLTVFTSILEVFLLCVAGYILAGRGILDKKTQKQINRLNVSLFTPALLFSKVAFFLSPAKLRELWVVPIFFVLVTSVSMAVSFTLGWLFGLKRSQRSFAMAASMFMNSNSLPIALMQSLVVSVPGLEWGDDDNKHAMVGRALTYLVVYSTLGMILRWSYGVKLLSQADEPELGQQPEVDETTPLLGFEHDQGTSSPVIVTDDPNMAAAPVPRPPPRRRTTYYKSFPNSPTREAAPLPPDTNCSNSIHSATPSLPDVDGTDPEDSPLYSDLPVHNARKSSRTGLYRFKRRFQRYWISFNDFMTVPLWAALASIFVACIRPIQYALDNHVQFIKGAVSSAGKCSIPLTLIVLGAYFYPPPDEEGEDIGKAAQLSTSKSSDTLVDNVKGLFHVGSPHRRPRVVSTPGETKTVVIAVLSRMIITPLLLMPLMAASAKFDWQPVFEDPVFVVANVVLISSPPALTLAQITQAASGDAFERLISRTIFWSYCIVTPPATILYVVVGLVLAKL
ncbi:membrane transport protein-domain-containing protein [Collybia nuda]|uniref:Membrane transport protein-domain-containing protein n=1 Tax=Collybia nuda TaxID=64659 RepID=A0A9P6CEY6_9AGAR|nr:membrane transport protein-domain-containing protein [Collybia nuda]